MKHILTCLLLVLSGAAYAGPAAYDDPDGYEEPEDCDFWQTNRNDPSFGWKATSYRVCLDYHQFKREGKRISEKLEAGMAALNDVQREFETRSDYRLDLLRKADKTDDPVKAAALEAEAYALNFTPNTKYEMVEARGLLIILEYLEQGY